MIPLIPHNTMGDHMIHIHIHLLPSSFSSSPFSSCRCELRRSRGKEELTSRSFLPSFLRRIEERPHQ